MADLLSIAEQAYNQLFPSPNDEAAVEKEEFQATAKVEYATQMWLKAKGDKREDGFFDIPSNLLTEEEFDIKNSSVDLNGVGILRSLDNDIWLQSVGGVGCECQYIKTSLNLYKTLCDDDSLPENSKLYYVVGYKIIFPEGTHQTPIKIIYANNGTKVDGRIEIDDAVAGVIRSRLVEIYGGKVGKEDKTNNSSSVN